MKIRHGRPNQKGSDHRHILTCGPCFGHLWFIVYFVKFKLITLKISFNHCGSAVLSRRFKMFILSILTTLTYSSNTGLSLSWLFVQPTEEGKCLGNLFENNISVIPFGDTSTTEMSESEAIRLHILMNKHSERYRSSFSYTCIHCIAQLRPQVASDKNTSRVYKWRSARIWCPKPQSDTKWLHYAWNHVHITMSIEHLKIDISEARQWFLRKLRALKNISEAIQSVNKSMNRGLGIGGK